MDLRPMMSCLVILTPTAILQQQSCPALPAQRLGHTEISRPPKFLPSKPYMASSASRSSMNSTKPKPRGLLQEQHGLRACSLRIMIILSGTYT